MHTKYALLNISKIHPATKTQRIHGQTFLLPAAIRASNSGVHPRASTRVFMPPTTSPSCTTSLVRWPHTKGPTKSLLMSRRGTELRTAPARLANGSTCRAENLDQDGFDLKICQLRNNNQEWILQSWWLVRWFCWVQKPIETNRWPCKVCSPPVMFPWWSAGQPVGSLPGTWRNGVVAPPQRTQCPASQRPYRWDTEGPSRSSPLADKTRNITCWFH